LWTKFVHIVLFCIFEKNIPMKIENRSYSSFGEHIRRLRAETSLSLREVAFHLDIDPSFLAKIERNERQPTTQLIEQISNYYKVHKKELINELLSDQIANKIYHEDAVAEILKVAEKKVLYLKTKNNG